MIAWVDFSKKDRERASELINSLEYRPVDELGVSLIRDAFADYFFPGTSTVQTRAKYFVLVPQIILKVVKDIKGNEKVEEVMKKIDEEEKACAERLKKGNGDDRDTLGIIGSRNLENGIWVARSPMDIYWNGIKTYGIYKDGYYTRKEYIQYEINRKKKKNQRINNKNDDKDIIDEEHKIFWTENIPKNDIDKINIELSNEEAEFLYEQILNMKETSLLKYILLHRNEFETIIKNKTSFAEFKKGIDENKIEIDDDIDRTLNIASSFNDFASLLFARYNMIIFREEKPKVYKEREKDWDILLGKFKENEKKKPLDNGKICERFYIKDGKLKEFLLDAIKNIRKDNFAELEKTIEKREIDLKGKSNSKILHHEKINNFANSEYVGLKELDYRYRSAKQLIIDIWNGMNNK